MDCPNLIVISNCLDSVSSIFDFSFIQVINVLFHLINIILLLFLGRRFDRVSLEHDGLEHDKPNLPSQASLALIQRESQQRL